MGSAPDEPLGRFMLDDDGSGLKLEYDSNHKLGDWQLFEYHQAILQGLSDKMRGTPFRRRSGSGIGGSP